MKSFFDKIYFFNLKHVQSYSNSRKRIQRLKIIIYFFVITVPIIIINDSLLALVGEQPYTFEKYPVMIFWLFCLLALFLAKKRFYKASKLIIIFSPLVFITSYALTGFIIGEHFLWQPVMVLGISVIPYLVLDFEKERLWLIISFFTFLFYIIFHDDIMMYGTDNNSFGPLYDKLNTTPFIYNAVRILIFLFLSIIIFYSVRLNDYQQKQNKKINNSLKSTSDYLERVNAELHAQRKAINNSASMLIFDDKMEVISVNTNYLNVSGFQEENLIGKSLEAILAPFHDQEFIQVIFDELENGRVWRGELKLQQANGAYIWMESAISGIYDSEQMQNGLLVIMFNITKLKDDEARLGRLNHEKDRILYAVAHDLKNPLMNFKALLNLIQSGAINEEEKDKVLNLMLKDCDHSTNLIQELLDIGRLEDETFVLVKQPVDLSDYINNLLNDIEQKQRGRIAIEKSFDERIGEIEINEKEFVRVLHNLMSNAIKFTPDGGEVKISTRLVDKDKVALEISDTGVGISGELLPIIFDKFSKAGRKGIKGEKSTGLGMWIVKHIVKLHGGDIKVASRVYEGTTFTITLPKRSVES